MSSPSLYRRHRPRTFADVVGQESIVRTLRNAIERDAVHHAYLFVGSRGTGKTSMAKILAAALNCQNGPTIEPCGTCAGCVAIAQSTSLDVIEMDAASNNGVDDVRDLRDRVALAPVTGSHKVYILDEAHMLSTQAWNAFLKTLEEPPPNTVFVLATTEANKVLPTVADRCHRFDFQRPSAADVGEVVSRVAVAEGIAAGPEVLSLIARSADGSFRDALGTLEQLVTYAGQGGEISQDDALAVLGVVDSDLRFRAIDAVCDRDPAAAVRTAAAISDSGRDMRRFMDDLEAHSRALLLIDLIGEVPPEMSVTDESDRRLADQSRRLGRAGVIRLLDLIAEAFAAIATGADARLRLELLLVKAADAGVALKGPSVAPPSGGSPSAPAPMTSPSSPATAQAAAPSSPVATPPPTSNAIDPGRPQGAPASQPTTVASAGGALRVVAEPDLVEESVVEAAAQPGADAADAPPAAQPGEMPAEAEVLAAWQHVISHLRQETPMIAALLTKAWPQRVDGSKVVLAFPVEAEFHCRKAQDERCREAIKDAFAGVIGIRPELVFEITDGDSPIAPEVERTLSLDEVATALVSEFGAVELSAIEQPESEGGDAAIAPDASVDSSSASGPGSAG